VSLFGVIFKDRSSESQSDGHSYLADLIRLTAAVLKERQGKTSHAVLAQICLDLLAFFERATAREDAKCKPTGFLRNWPRGENRRE